MFSDGQTLFIRDTDSGKCITRAEELPCANSSYALPYFVVMTDNCLNISAQFSYRDTELLKNIEKNGTMVSPSDKICQNRPSVFKGVSHAAVDFQNKKEHSLKQTNDGTLLFYRMNASVCADVTPAYVIRNTTCDTKKQRFTFGMWLQWAYDVAVACTVS